MTAAEVRQPHISGDSSMKAAHLSLVVVALAITLTAQAQVLVPRSGQRNPLSYTTHNQSGIAQDGSGPLIFLPEVTYPDPTGFASAVAAGDLRGNGKVDLVAVGQNVEVFLGNGDGTFQPAVSYPTGRSGLWSVAIADVNGDGKPDLLVVSDVNPATGFNSVGVLLGNGDGTFQPVVFYSAGGVVSNEFNYQSIAVADVNGDGKPDLLVANAVPGVGVLLGNGDGTFQPVVTYTASPIFQTQSLAAADVNGDGKIDLIVTGFGESGGLAAVLLGNGDGTFQPAVAYSTGGNANAVAVADVNGDGKPDILVANGYGAGVLLGNGDGTFQPVTTYSSGGAYPQPQSIAVADVNQDGKPDLLLVNNLGGMAVLLGNGDGTFQAAVIYGLGAPTPTCVVASDVNGDGKPDLIVADQSVEVLLNNNGAPPTTIVLTSNVNPVTLWRTVTYTASVSIQSGAALGGSVTFNDGNSVTVPVSNNQASYSTTYRANRAGLHPITAAYSGVLDQAAGVLSGTLTENVRLASVTTLTTSGSPSKVGSAVTFTAGVRSRYGTIPAGELVTFYDGSKTLASVPLEGGEAVYTTSSLSVGTHDIKAVYSGDNTFASSKAHVTQVVQP
jgi:hypothetical protein